MYIIPLTVETTLVGDCNNNHSGFNPYTYVIWWQYCKQVNLEVERLSSSPEHIWKMLRKRLLRLNIWQLKIPVH